MLAPQLCVLLDEGPRTVLSSDRSVKLFLSDPEQLRSLVGLITEDPSPDSDSDRCLKYPYAAVDFFAAGLQQICTPLVENYELMTKLFGFLFSDSFHEEESPIYLTEMKSEQTEQNRMSEQNEYSETNEKNEKNEKNERNTQNERTEQAKTNHKLTKLHTSEKDNVSLTKNPNLQAGMRVTTAGLAQRVVLALLDNGYFLQILNFLKSKKAVPILASKSSIPVVSEIILKLILRTEGKIAIQWLCNNRFFDILKERLLQKDIKEDEFESIITLLDNIAFKMCECKDNERGLFRPIEPDLNLVLPPPQVNMKPIEASFFMNTSILRTLFKLAIDKRNTSIFRLISHVVRYCTHSPLPSVNCQQTISTLAPHAGALYGPSLTNPYNVWAGDSGERKNSQWHLNTRIDVIKWPIFSLFTRSLEELKRILKEKHDVLGTLRLSVISLIADFAECGYTRVVFAISESKILHIIVDLFYTHIWNNFLQFSVFRIIIASILSTERRMRYDIIKNAKFFHRGIEIDTKHFAESEDHPGSVLGFVGIFTLLCRMISECEFSNTVNTQWKQNDNEYDFTCEQITDVKKLIGEVESEYNFTDYITNVIQKRREIDDASLTEGCAVAFLDYYYKDENVNYFKEFSSESSSSEELSEDEDDSESESDNESESDSGSDNDNNSGNGIEKK